MYLYKYLYITMILHKGINLINALFILNENGIENCIEPLSMKMLSVLFSFNAQVPSDRHRSKTQDRGAQSHREGITEYAPSYALLHFFRTLTFCKRV